MSEYTEELDLGNRLIAEKVNDFAKEIITALPPAKFDFDEPERYGQAAYLIYTARKYRSLSGKKRWDILRASGSRYRLFKIIAELVNDNV